MENVRKRGMRRRWLPALVVVISIGAMAGCSGGAPRPRPTERADKSTDSTVQQSVGCDDRVRGRGVNVPRELRDRIGRIPADSLVGGDPLFFFAPASRWGDNASPDGGRFHGKFPLYVNASEEPEVVAQDATGRLAMVEISPTSEGAPGPLPVGIAFPSPGCWTITARLDGVLVEIEAEVG